MPSATFLCPNCTREYQKGAEFIVTRTVMQVVRCPGCGCMINCADLMRGDFDSGMTPTGWQVMLLLGLLNTGAILLLDGWQWWQAALVGFLLAGLIARMWSHYEWRREARRAVSGF